MLTKITAWFAGLIIPAWLPILAAACISGGIAWKIQGWRMDGMKAEYVQAEIKAQAEARSKEQEWNTRFQTAINKGVEREKTYRTHAANARAAADSLRVQLNANKRELSDLTQSALVQRASTLTDVFGACAEEYRSLAEEADRHVNDKVTVREAWPG